MRLPEDLPAAWRPALAGRLPAERWSALAAFVDAERAVGAVFPPEPRVFAALALTPPEAVRVMLIGQDPYHDDGQAQGLAFSVPAGVRFPPSLRNLFKERQSDLGLPPPVSGDLSDWARQGVLLLNSVLTVRAHQAGSHRGRGWEALTDAVLDVVNAGPPAVFVLWGAAAQAKRERIDETRHRVLASAHPSPLSAHRGFFGSRPFSRINQSLNELGRPPVDWRCGSERQGE